LLGSINSTSILQQRGEIDCGKDADAGDEGQKAAQREISVCQRAQIDDRTPEKKDANCPALARNSTPNSPMIPRARARKGWTAGIT
jgi:hypothetical protein